MSEIPKVGSVYYGGECHDVASPFHLGDECELGVSCNFGKFLGKACLRLFSPDLEVYQIFIPTH